MDPLISILTVSILALLFGSGLLFFISKLGPKIKKSTTTLMPYECGLPGVDQKTSQISVKFYLTAILYILFDIEIIFLFPWALLYSSKTELFLFVEMMLFIFILILGLLYIWRSDALKWD